MKIRVLAFGMARDLCGTGEFLFEGSEGMTAAQFKSELVQKFPALNALMQFAVAVNQEYVDDGIQLHEMDEVALIPPVSGG